MTVSLRKTIARGREETRYRVSFDGGRHLAGWVASVVGSTNAPLWHARPNGDPKWVTGFSTRAAAVEFLRSQAEPDDRHQQRRGVPRWSSEMGR